MGTPNENEKKKKRKKFRYEKGKIKCKIRKKETKEMPSKWDANIDLPSFILCLFVFIFHVFRMKRMDV